MKKLRYLEEWLELKPYDKLTKTDRYYIKICARVRKILTSDELAEPFNEYLIKKEIIYLACFLTSYLEDIVSGSNIWNTFIINHYESYGKYLPFYPTNDYYIDDLNPEDIAFLIWYFLNSIQDEGFVEPYNEFILAAADKIFVLFENVIDSAPENKYLKTFYQMDINETDFYSARALVDAVLFRTYLFFPDTYMKLLDKEHDLINKVGFDENIDMYLRENRDLLIFSQCTRLLAYNGPEWAAEILGTSHPLYDHFFNMSKKISGQFFYKGQNDDYLFIEHIASGKRFEVTKKSFTHAHTLTEIDTIVFIGIVRWMDEWWFSGNFFQQPYNADIVLDEKNSMNSRLAVNFLDAHSEETMEILEKQLEAFLAFNNGSQIAFMPAEEIEEFLQRYIDYYNNTLNLTEDEKEAARKRMKKDGFLRESGKEKVITEDRESALLFFNPQKGTEVAVGINSAFPFPNNPYFSEKDSNLHVWQLLSDENISTELAYFCIDNCKNDLSFFKDSFGELVLDELDFLLRFWKNENYYSKPTMALIGSGNNR